MFLFIYLMFFIIKYGDGAAVSKISDYKTSVTINCSIEVPTFNPKIIEELVYNCQTPESPYVDILTRYQLTKLKTLKLNIEATKLNITLNSSLFENLNVTNLIIDYKYVNKSGKIDLIRMNSDVLYILNSVQNLEIRGIAVIENKKIGKADDDSPQCASLQVLRVSASDLKLVPSGWLRPCKQLLHLHLSALRQRNATKETRRKVLDGARSLRKLEILNCFIEELEDELSGLENLEVLNVAHNQIHYALTTIILPRLTVLDLSYNHIFSSALLSSGVEKQPSLKVLSLDFNSVLDICDDLGYRTTAFEQSDATWHSPLNGRTLNLHSIQRFSLRGTITNKMCFGHLNMSSLEYFDLSDSKISSIDFSALPVSRTRRLEVNVTGCPIEHSFGIWFSKQDYERLHHEELRITGLNLKLECDCDEYLWLAKASRERRVILSGASCMSGHDLSIVPIDLMQCRKMWCEEASECTCRWYWQDNSTDVQCESKGLHRIPRIPGVRMMFASNNMLENITTADIPDSLIYLDLSGNHIARVSDAASAELFKNPRRRVNFFANPIICDCQNKPFIQALMDNFERVDNYSTMTCVDGELISRVNPFELCFGSSRLLQTTLASSLGALVGIIALLVGLYYRFGKAAKVYLYSKGLCLFCIRESEVDSDREYDAFISFSHKDEEFVINDLVPNLECEPYKYKLCLHYRNWIAGELIPAQISQSIRNSKRTIVVLSKSFLRSLWGLLEFRAAHLSSLKEGRTRLIIVIVDDILETGNLDGELRTYLRTNTYVKWGDPWFWDKIRYALPHRKVNIDTVEINKVSEEYFSFRTDLGDYTRQRDEKDENVLEIEDTKRGSKRERVTKEEEEEDKVGTANEEGVKEINETKRLGQQQNIENQNGDEEIEDTKEFIKDFNEDTPICQQISNDSAIGMDSLGYSSSS